jgi:enoyl-CoA hydratase/carnithine racemase
VTTQFAAGRVELRLEGPVLWARIVSPRTKNAIGMSILAGLEEMLAIARDREVKVVTIRGANGTFCSGADLYELRGMLADRDALAAFMRRLGGVFDDLEHGGWATVAVVEGHAVAGGCELLLASDVVITTDDARIGDGHIARGLVPAAGGSVRLPRAIPARLARYLLLTGEAISGKEAADIGLATIAVPPEALELEVHRVVDRLATRGRATLRTMKKMLAVNETLDLRPLLRRELDLFLDHVTHSPDAEQGLEAFLRRTGSNGSQPATSRPASDR